MPKRPPRRQWGSGSITWLGPSRALLRIRTLDGVRSRTVRTTHRDHGGRGEALDELERFRHEIEAAANAAPGHTVRQLLDAHREDCERRGKATTTLASYKDAARRLPDELADKAIGEVTPHDLDTFFGLLATKGYASTTIANTHAVLAAAFAQAVRWTWLDVNPVSASRPPAPKAAPKPKLTPTEVWALVQAAQAPKADGGDGDVVLAFAIFMAAVTGARRGELCGLRWDDLDTERCVIRIMRQWVAESGGQHLRDLKSQTGADDGVRAVYLGPAALGVIERFRDYSRDLMRSEPEGWMISHDAGATPMRAKSLGDAITKLAARQGFGRVTPHTLRKVTANYVKGTDDRAVAAAGALETRLIEQGMPMGELLAP